MEKKVAKEENTTRAPHKMSEGISMACIGSKWKRWNHKSKKEKGEEKIKNLISSAVFDDSSLWSRMSVTSHTEQLMLRCIKLKKRKNNNNKKFRQRWKHTKHTASCVVFKWLTAVTMYSFARIPLFSKWEFLESWFFSILDHQRQGSSSKSGNWNFFEAFLRHQCFRYWTQRAGRVEIQNKKKKKRLETDREDDPEASSSVSGFVDTMRKRVGRCSSCRYKRHSFLKCSNSFTPSEQGSRLRMCPETMFMRVLRVY